MRRPRSRRSRPTSTSSTHPSCAVVAAVKERIAGTPRPRRPARRSARCSRELLADATGSGGVPARRARQRHGRRDRPVAALSRRPTDRYACSASSCRPDSKTPVHDHLAWGLVGVYRGNQDEEFYRPRRRPARARPTPPARARRLLHAAPPGDDVHCVRTTSARRPSRSTCSPTTPAAYCGTPSTETTGEPRPFRSGYVNAVCESPPAGGAG